MEQIEKLWAQFGKLQGEREIHQTRLARVEQLMVGLRAKILEQQKNDDATHNAGGLAAAEGEHNE